MMFTPSTTPRALLTVSELNRNARLLLESSFSDVWVTGEISNLARPSSGHIYFTLKDANAQVKCAFFKNRQRQRALRASALESGQKIVVRADATLYEVRGDYQLLVKHIEPAGEGELQILFEKLKKRLEQEGLFDSERKRSLPTLPRQIGLITSSTGAALRDVLSVLRRRCPMIPVILYPTPVQGEGAAKQIAQQIDIANQRAECDILILCRGGGSIEDLWAFNDETLARTIAASTIPMISGVGHEIDFTIADFASDLRAPTPSAAAELAVPDQRKLSAELRALEDSLKHLVTQRLRTCQQQGHFLTQRLMQQDPRRQMLQNRQQVDHLAYQLQNTMQHHLNALRTRSERAARQLTEQSPRSQVHLFRQQLGYLDKNLARLRLETFRTYREKVFQLASALDAVSPLRTLDRGYSIVTDTASKALLSKTEQFSPGQKITTRLIDGSVASQVISIDSQPSK